MKTFLTYLALAGFTFVSAASAVRAVRSELNRAPAVDSAALGAWLVAPTRDDEKPSTLRRAARQLEQEFHDQIDRRPEYEALEKAARPTYETNWQRLLLILVRQHADAYAATPEPQRDAFVSQRLAQFGTWYVFDRGKKERVLDFLRHSLEEREDRLHLNPAERQRVEDLVKAMRQFPLKKFLEQVLPADTKPKADRDDR